MILAEMRLRNEDPGMPKFTRFPNHMVWGVWRNLEKLECAIVPLKPKELSRLNLCSSPL